MFPSAAAGRYASLKEGVGTEGEYVHVYSMGDVEIKPYEAIEVRRCLGFCFIGLRFVYGLFTGLFMRTVHLGCARVQPKLPFSSSHLAQIPDGVAHGSETKGTQTVLPTTA